MTLDYLSVSLLAGALCLCGLLVWGDKSSAFFKKYWWLLMVFLLVVIGVVLFRRKPSQTSSLEGAKDGGDKLRQDSLGSFDAIVDAAVEKASIADAELMAAKIRSDEERNQALFQIHAVKSISDPDERRAALAELLGKS